MGDIQGAVACQMSVGIGLAPEAGSRRGAWSLPKQLREKHSVLHFKHCEKCFSQHDKAL